MRATRNTMPSHSSSHSRAPKASHQADITAVSRYLSGHSADQNVSIVGAQLGPPCAHGAPGDEVPHWRSRRAPQPTSTFRRTSRRRCTSTWACRGRSSRPPLERIPIRSPSRFGGTLRPLAAGHSSQVWPLVSGSLLLLAIAIVLVLALAVADAGALAVALSRAISARHASTSSECYSSELLSASQGPSSAPLSLSVTRSGSLEGAVLLLDAMAWSKRLRISRLPAAAAAAAAAVAVASAAAAVALPFRRLPPISFARSVLSHTKGARCYSADRKGGNNDGAGNPRNIPCNHAGLAWSTFPRPSPSPRSISHSPARCSESRWQRFQCIHTSPALISPPDTTPFSPPRLLSAPNRPRCC